MFLKNQNLYINEKNIVTLQPYFNNGAYGLCINGINHEFGRHLNADKNIETVCLGKMKAVQTQIIKKIEKEYSIDNFVKVINKTLKDD